MDRRAFLTNVAVAGAAVGLAPLSSASAGVNAPPAVTAAGGVLPSGPAENVAPPAIQSVSRALFTRARRARFSVAGHDGRRLELAALHDGPRAPALDQFSVTFREASPGARPLPRANYVLEHPAHGRLLVHLEPVTDSPSGASYRATFCLLA